MRLLQHNSVAASFVPRSIAWIKRSNWEERGSSTLETALGLVILFTMMTGVMEFAMMGYTYSVYADAARAGARYAMTHGINSTTCSGPSSGCADSTGANVVSAVTNYTTGLTTLASSLKVNVSYPDNSSAPPSRVVVTVSYTYQPMFARLGISPTFSTSSTERIEF